MRGIIFTGGGRPEMSLAHPWLERFSYVIAADSGFLGAISAGIVPDLFLGDMDSLPDPSILTRYPKMEKKIWPIDKDYSDTELALAAMIEKGINDIVLVGGSGGRMDHFFALRSLFDKDFVPGVWIGEESVVVAVGTGCPSRQVVLNGLSADDAVSVFPAGNESHACVGHSFHWSIDELQWDKGAFSLSNRSESDRVGLDAVSGRFLLVVPLRAGIRFERG